MKEEFITFDTAKLAKEKGIDSRICGRVYVGNAEWEERLPTQSLLQKWLRDVHGIQVYVKSMTKDGNGNYRDYVAYILGKEGYGVSVNDPRDEEYQTYEEALEVGLERALGLIKTPDIQ